ncbi:MAG: GGDEF domain-containing protein, partial [Marinicella sp.]
FKAKYKEWDRPSRQVQIAASAFLTALLYVVFSLLNKSWASDQIQSLMLKAHLLVVAPMLLIISVLAYKRQFYQFVMVALGLAPVIAIVCHTYIADKLPIYAPFQMEGYLVIFWTFVISGLTFRLALVSAACSSTILLISAYGFMDQSDFYTMHVFWVVCCFSFGFLAALIFDKSRKAIFVSHQKLHHMAITDALTGLFNRNHLNQVLSEEIDKCKQNGNTFGLLILDIDHFKNINDTLGHDEGDRVLILTARFLSTLINKQDTLIRWGGEEFIVVAPEVNNRDIIQFCEKIRKQVAGERFNALGIMTVSIGATLFNKNDSQDALIARADKALYAAKANGRNNSVYIN